MTLNTQEWRRTFEKEKRNNKKKNSINNVTKRLVVEGRFLTFYSRRLNQNLSLFTIRRKD